MGLRFSRSHKQTISKLTAFCGIAVAVFLLSALPTFAQQDFGLGIIDRVTGFGSGDLRVIIISIVRIALGFVGIVAVIYLIYGGYVWMTSAGNEQRVDEAKAIIRNAIIGIVIIFFSFAIVSFIIGALRDALNGGNRPPRPPQACDNCGYLGTGIIESVYPAPYARDVARNTNIVVRFKVAMDRASIINDANNDNTFGNCVNGVCDTLKSGSVLIYPDTAGTGSAIDPAQVAAITTDGKTYTFNPQPLLGNGTDDVWYGVRLTNNIEKDNGQSAFPGVGSYFTWRFEVGTTLDLDPPELVDVFPVPDDSSDTYQQTTAVQATGDVALTQVPRPEQAAGYNQTATVLAPTGGLGATVTGSYNGTFTGTIEVTLSGDTPNATATVFWNTNHPNNRSGVAIQSNTIVLGAGLTLVLNGDPAGDGASNEWQITGITPFRAADTLQVAGRTYTFVANNPGQNEIVTDGTRSGTANNIQARINADNLPVSASAGSYVVTFTARLAGTQGNQIPLQATGGWETIVPMSGGQNQGFTSTTPGNRDQPRNAIITFNFNEAIDSSKLPNDIRFDENRLRVEFFGLDNEWHTATGTITFSNQWRTAEFRSETECVDTQTGQPLRNSCGDKLYCLPVNTPTPYVATAYRVTVQAGLLAVCSGAGGSCTDGSYSQCVPTQTGGSSSACQGTFGTVTAFYPETATDPQGAVDMANNSFNGNRDTYELASGQTLGRSQGPQSQSGQAAFDLNNEAPLTTGDDLVWSFYINNNISLAPPNITAIEPTIFDSRVNLIDPIEATFDSLLRSSTLKPGTGYEDGLCACQTNADCSADGSVVCDLTGAAIQNTYGKCRAVDGNDQFCADDNQCDGPSICVNKKYVGLLDQGARPVGYWIGQTGLDVAPADGFSDQTRGEIRHSAFSEVTGYGAEFGSGIQDIYQNCFLPSGGPGVSGGSCNTTDTQPYCCNGVAMNQQVWEGSACFTGY